MRATFNRFGWYIVEICEDRATYRVVAPDGSVVNACMSKPVAERMAAEENKALLSSVTRERDEAVALLRGMLADALDPEAWSDIAIVRRKYARAFLSRIEGGR